MEEGFQSRVQQAGEDEKQSHVHAPPPVIGPKEQRDQNEQEGFAPHEGEEEEESVESRITKRLYYLDEGVTKRNNRVHCKLYFSRSNIR